MQIFLIFFTYHKKVLVLFVECWDGGKGGEDGPLYHRAPGIHLYTNQWIIYCTSLKGKVIRKFCVSLLSVGMGEGGGEDGYIHHGAPGIHLYTNPWIIQD